jgi:hypothetical protein
MALLAPLCLVLVVLAIILGRLASSYQGSPLMD